MGARINYVFKDSEQGPAVVLYSHWGQDGWGYDIRAALEHARPRWQDSSYATRMMISHLIQNNVLDETGFGIYAVNSENLDFGDQTVFIDFTNNTITDSVPVTFNNFIMAYNPQPLESLV